MLNARVLLTALLACLALVAVACGGDDDGDAGETPAAETQAEPAPETEPAETEPAEESAEPSAEVRSVKGIPKDLKERPKVRKPSGEPPSELVTVDVVEGDGKTAKEGDLVSMQYVGANWSNGEEFDASWNRGEAFEFQLGGGQVIPGWDEGIVGMKEGGRRKLVIPPDKGYGPNGTPDGSIPPNETLVFIVDLEKVTSG
jgi:peptidylprolyl isomerase